MPVFFHSENIPYQLNGKIKHKKWIARIVELENSSIGDLNIIFTNCDYLRAINKEYLNRDYDTDVITFNYNEGRTINGEIYISAERVRENAETYGALLKTEIRRVIFHGVLHLCGYDDRTKEEKKKMSEMEEMYLALSYAE